ncbi:MAG: sugar transferase [Nannocystaceae bacterium]|nr:sugar transferase [bacterium]
MTRHQAVLFRQIFLLSDLFVSVVAFFAALSLRQWLPSVSEYVPAFLGRREVSVELFLATDYPKFLLGMVPLWALVFHFTNTADFRAGPGRTATRYLRAVAVGLGLLVVASFWFKVTFLSRSFVFLFGATQFVFLLTWRLSARTVIRRMKRVDDHRVLIVGTGAEAVAFARSLKERSSWNNRLVGFVSVLGQPELTEAEPILGKIEDLTYMLDTEVVDEVVFAVPERSHEDFAEALAACDERGVDVLLSMPSTVQLNGEMELANMTGFNMPMIGITQKPTGEVRLLGKRLLDVVASFFGIIAISPLLATVALIIKLEDGGPILFKQVRSGLQGRKFPMLKFRSMCVDAEKKKAELMHLNEMDGPVFKIKHDPRITRIGRFIRKTSIDELPQLFNVLVGQMSLVGPRPPLPSEVAQYKPRQRRRLSVRPGITGLWQVSGRSDISDFDQWMALDLQYIDTWSLWLDIKILLKTVPVVLLHKGAS